MKKIRAGSIFSAILAFTLLEIFIWFPTFIWAVIPLILIDIFVSIWRILPKNYQIKEELRKREGISVKLIKILKIFWEDRNYTFLISPAFLFLGVISFIVFIKSIILVHLTILFFAVFYFLFLEGLFSYFYKKESYFLENIFTITNFIALFLIYSALFSLLSLFNFSLWKISLLFIFFTYLSNHQLLHVYRIKEEVNYFYNVVITMVMAESFWAVVFLPTNFYVNAIVLLGVYYAILGIGHFYLEKSLNKVRVIRHITISLLIIILSLLTARWT